MCTLGQVAHTCVAAWHGSKHLGWLDAQCEHTCVSMGSSGAGSEDMLLLLLLIPGLHGTDILTACGHDGLSNRPCYRSYCSYCN